MNTKTINKSETIQRLKLLAQFVDSLWWDEIEPRHWEHLEEELKAIIKELEE